MRRRGRGKEKEKTQNKYWEAKGKGWAHHRIVRRQGKEWEYMKRN